MTDTATPITAITAITPITTPLMITMSVNCYLVESSAGFVLIDTGIGGQRSKVEAAIRNAGCQPGDLKLIVLTHGDFDHCGNAAYFRETFGAQIAMHPDDLGMVRDGDMFWNRQQPNVIMRALAGAFFRLGKADRFEPDITVTEGHALAAYGLEVIHLPGHSKGSIGLLTTGGDLFCGDLLGNTKKPALWMMIDDEAAAQTSVEKLKAYEHTTVHPGHGQPFPMMAFLGERV